MENIKLYHKSVFWEKRFNIEALEIMKSAERARRFSKHLIKDRIEAGVYNRDFTPDDIINALRGRGYIFEVETKNGKVTKSCARFNFSDRKDIIIVCREGIVITAWLCWKNDHHKTLNKRKYCTS